MAPTVIALGADAGDLVDAETPSFPEATTERTPDVYADCTAVLKAVDEGPPVLYTC